MLIRQFTDDGKSYTASLKKRLTAFCVMAALGVVGMVVSGLWLAESTTLPDFLKGFYTGASFGLAGAGMILCIRTARLLRSDKARRTAEIEEKDERRQYIATQSAQVGAAFVLAAGTAALMVTVAVNLTVFWTLFAVVAAEAAVIAAAYLWLGRKV